MLFLIIILLPSSFVLPVKSGACARAQVPSTVFHPQASGNEGVDRSRSGA